MKPHYYNEFNLHAAEWIRNLINARLIPAGVVDTRSIVDVKPQDLAGFAQCHFFAGIAGWALAARLAGWPDDRELWTGSPPCQPFSVAGQQRGISDKRHLWPYLRRLIAARRPASFMGEQVAAAVGKHWLDGVLVDLEKLDYTGRAVVIPACAVNAPHRRDRLWVVAHPNRPGQRAIRREGVHFQGRPRAFAAQHHAGAMAYANVVGGSEGREQRSGELGGARSDSRACPRTVADPLCEGSQVGIRHTLVAGESSRGSEGVVVADDRQCGAWDGAQWIIGHDGKARRVEPSIRLLAHGIPGRVGRLRAYGNSIVPEVAAEVLAAYLDVYPEW